MNGTKDNNVTGDTSGTGQYEMFYYSDITKDGATVSYFPVRETSNPVVNQNPLSCVCQVIIIGILFGKNVVSCTYENTVHD